MAKRTKIKNNKGPIDLEPMLTDRYFVGELEKLAELHYTGLGFKRLDDLEKIFNPLLKRSIKDYEEPEKEILRWMRQPDYWWFTCQHLLNIDLHPFQGVILKTLYDHAFSMLIASRGASKSFLLALFSVLYSFAHQNTKAIIAGTGFRQSRLVFEYIEGFWNNAPVMQSIIGPASRHAFSKASDRWTFRFGRSVVHAIPVGDGKKIRGFRSNLLFMDEFQSQNPEIYEKVMSGFGATSSDPVKNAKQQAKIEFYKDHGLWDKAAELAANRPNANKQILSGTADYEFGHFYRYYKQYSDIIKSGGDEKIISEIFGGKYPDGIKHTNFAVIQLPVDLLPPAFMDEDNISRSKLVLSHNLYVNEFGACFSADSDGYYKASLIKSCVTNPPVELSTGPVSFSAVLRGDIRGKYYYGIDPAQSKDNFAVVILEIRENHRRVVHCWVTNDEDYKKKVKDGFTKDNTFYSYCCQKIRALMRVFPCEIMSIDMQGGGRAIMESLRDLDKMDVNDKQLWPVRSDHPLGDKKFEEYDNQAGLHIIEPVQLANIEYTATANNGLKKDLEDKVLLFPFYDTVAIAEAFIDDNTHDREYDTLEECYENIEELKKELASIQETKTASGRSHWAAPDTKTPGMERAGADDRFVALLMANAAARKVERNLDYRLEVVGGGFVGSNKFGSDSAARQGERYLRAPLWFLEQIAK